MRPLQHEPTDILIGFALDKSGSMHSVREATIEGFNQFLAEQQANEDGRAFLSLTLFDEGFYPRYVARDVREVPAMSERGDNHFQPGGQTALYDAMAVTIEGIDGWLRNHREFTGKVLIVSWTDGGENESRQYSRFGDGLSRLNALVADRQNNAGWDFAFLGSGGAAWTEGSAFAHTMGLANVGNVAVGAAGVGVSFAAVSHAVSQTRTTGQYGGMRSSLNAVDPEQKSWTDTVDALAEED